MQCKAAVSSKKQKLEKKFVPKIAKDNKVITVIFSLATAPDRQQELVDLMIEALQTTVKH